MEILELKKIGFTDGEVKVYKALLEIGECTRTELAKKSGISPSKIYDVTARLSEKGIISSVTKDGILHFAPQNPERITDFIHQKVEEVRKEVHIIEKILPMLMQQYNEKKEKIDIEVLYGWEGMRAAFDDIARNLGKGDTNYIFGASTGQNSKQADLFFTKYYRRVADKGYKVKIIFNENVRANTSRTDYYANNKPHEVRYLHQDTFSEINLYRNNVLFIMLLYKPIVIKVTSKEAADSFRKFFETMWKAANR